MWTSRASNGQWLDGKSLGDAPNGLLRTASALGSLLSRAIQPLSLSEPASYLAATWPLPGDAGPESLASPLAAWIGLVAPLRATGLFDGVPLPHKGLALHPLSACVQRALATLEAVNAL